MLDKTATSAPTLTLGDLRVTCHSDGHLLIPAAFFPDADPLEKKKVTPHTRFGANTWLIETGERTILVDAGSGDWLKARYPQTGLLGWQGEDLEERRSKVTDIIVTHMHADHIGGLSAGGTSLFPNAELHVQAAEWDYWTDEALINSVAEDRKPLVGLIQALARPIESQVTLHSGEKDLGGGVLLFPAPGHTPGHQAVHLSSGSKEVYLLADVVVSDALQFANPEAVYALETDPELAAATRKFLFERLAFERTPFAATHLNETGFGCLEKQTGGFRFEAL
ncbi:MBL fold metallo-hydrolase [Roseibium sp.]|uniref:MBL fold metallo-hydrolase n=1 Tax=Roseibium sp. TaxID=1936156 RepID=UPI003D0BA6ED